jgi:hypothetical protein
MGLLDLLKRLQQILQFAATCNPCTRR